MKLVVRPHLLVFMAIRPGPAAGEIDHVDLHRT